MTGETYDVLVAGAGPAGSVCARDLAEAGHRVALVDENPGPRQSVVCTGIIGEEAFQTLDLPGVPVEATIRRARFYSPSGREVTYEPPEPLARVVSRTTFDGVLAKHAASAGAHLLRGHAAREVEKDADRVTVRAETEDGDRWLGARALVVATGHQRWLHEASGLGVPESYVHGVHADLPFRDLDAAELYFGNDVAPGFFAWAVPFSGGMARLGVLAPQGARRLFRRFVRRPEICHRLGVELENGDGRRLRRALNSRGIVQGPVTPSYSDRVLAVGEAAGQVKTTTAGGIYYGMIGGGLAAEVLDRALRRDALGAEQLSVYEDRWRERLEAEIQSGLELQRKARALDDSEIDRIFGALQNGVAATIREVVRFDWHRPALRVLFRRKELWRHLRDGVTRETEAVSRA